MENIRKCKLCGYTIHNTIYKAEDHFTQEYFYLVRCSNCNLIFTNPRPTQKELNKYYPPSYYGEFGQRFNPIIEKAVQYFRKRLADKIDENFLQSGRILEIGSGRGTLLSEMSKKGWIAIGTEFSESLVEKTTNTFGVRVFQSPNLNDCEFPDDYFDAVLCYHVLEHLPDPFSTLAEIHRIMRSQGLLIIAVPNIGGYTARISKNHWFGIDVPRHLFHFTQKTLKRALNIYGFEIISQSTLSMEQDVFGFAQSILNLIGFPNNIFYDFIRSPAGRMRHDFKNRNRFNNLFQKSILFIIGGGLSIIGLFISPIVALFSYGGTIEYWSTQDNSEYK